MDNKKDKVNVNKDGNDFFALLIGNTRLIILISIGIACGVSLLSCGLRRTEQIYAFPSCAILWAGGLIALAICDKGKGKGEN
jgi:hypothetical protein